MRKPPLTCWLLSFVGVCVLSGCGGDERYQIVPVSGIVKLGGQPLAGANLNLQPIAPPESDGNPGPASMATTDAKGHFTLKTIDGDSGAVVGKHRLTVVSAEESRIGESDEVIDIKSPIPDDYRNGQVEIEIKAGGDENMVIDIPAKG